MTLHIGHGYDVHAFAPNRRLVLGGVEVAYPCGLAGHSDADVLTHALADAILGACRMGDIGKLFPDTDPAYKDACSLDLLSHVMGLARQTGYELLDCDCTIAAQAPKLVPYRDQMRHELSSALGVTPAQVGVKATTTEHLGFVGRQEGIAAWAVCLMEHTSA